MSETVSTPTASAPASSPAAPVSAPATTSASTTSTPTAPAPSAAPAPFDAKQFPTMKGALDAFVKSKMTAATEQPATAETPTPAPAETAEVAPVEGEPIQPAEKAQLAGEPTTDRIEVGPDPDLQIDPKVVKSVSPRVRAVLKMLVDPVTKLPIGGATRKEIVDNYFVGKSVRDSGLPVSALREYLAVAPTVDVLKDVSENATNHARMLKDYASDPGVFAEQLHATNPDAFSNLVSSITDPAWLQATYSKQFAAIAKTGTRNYLENAIADAQRSGDADLEAAVGKLMEWGGLASPPQNQPAPAQPENPLQGRLEQLEAERAQIQQEKQQAFLGTAYQWAATGVSERIAALVTQAAADSPFNEKTQGRIKDEIGRKLYANVTGNQHIIRTLDGLLRSGPQDRAHVERVATYLQSQALALLPSVSREVIEEYSELVGPAVTQRQQKVEKALAQRPSVGGGGQPARSPAPAFDPKAFSSTKDAFDAFVKNRLSG